MQAVQCHQDIAVSNPKNCGVSVKRDIAHKVRMRDLHKAVMFCINPPPPPQCFSPPKREFPIRVYYSHRSTTVNLPILISANFYSPKQIFQTKFKSASIPGFTVYFIIFDTKTLQSWGKVMPKLTITLVADQINFYKLWLSVVSPASIVSFCHWILVWSHLPSPEINIKVNKIFTIDLHKIN